MTQGSLPIMNMNDILIQTVIHTYFQIDICFIQPNWNINCRTFGIKVNLVERKRERERETTTN